METGRVLSVSIKLGIFSWYGYKAPLSQCLEHIKQAGFSSTMLWWGDDELDPQIDNELFKKAADMGVTVENIHVPFSDANWLWATEHDIHKAYLSRHMKYLDFSAKHGFPTIVMHISKGYQVVKPNKYGIDTMKRLTRYAQEVGVSIVIENTRRVGLIEAILEAIECKNLGLCYDTSHGGLYEDSEFYLLKKFPFRLKCVHISDNDGLEDRHWNINEGVVDWNSFINNFPKESECQTLSLEVYPKDASQAEANFLRDAYSRVSALRELIETRTS